MASSMFELVTQNQSRIPKRISVIIWDIDGTITEFDQLDTKLTKFIVDSALTGVIHVFITGRDRFWMIKSFLKPLEQIAGNDFAKIAPHLILFPELGLMTLDPLSHEPTIFENVLTHPLMIGIGSVRDRLASFFWKSQQLQPYKQNDSIPNGHFIGKDANDNSYLFPINPHNVNAAIIFPDFIWSDTKELIATAEVMRDARQKITGPRNKKIMPAAEIIKLFLDYWDIKEIKVSAVGTAINIVPVLDGIVLDKDWTAGRVLTILSQKKGATIPEIAEETIAIGDGSADFLCAIPRVLGNNDVRVAFAFVGKKEQYTKNPDQAQQVIAKSIPDFSGPCVTNEIISWLQDQNKFAAF